MSRNSKQIKGKISKATNEDLENTLLELLEKNDRLVVLASSFSTHALPINENSSTHLAEMLATHFPIRFYGLGEYLEELVPTTNRLVAAGLVPLVLMTAADLTRSYSSIAALCVQRLPILLLLDTMGERGQTMIPERASDIALLLTLPPLVVGAPSGAASLRCMLQTALAYQEGPVALLYEHGSLPEEKSPLLLEPKWGLGKSYMLREGKDLAIFALGAGVSVALNAAKELAHKGIEASVIDACWARPLDEPLISAVATHLPRLVTLENGPLQGGFGANILELLERKNLYNVKVERLNSAKSVAIAAEITTFLGKVREIDGFTSQFHHIGNQVFSR